MIILAFLQNLWVKDPARWKEILEKYPDRRVGIIRHLLLDYGCLTGRRIKNCFGEDLVEQMIFEEASREIAGDSKTICPPDRPHIKACLEKYKPKAVVTFGKVAEDAVRPAWINWSIYEPAAAFIACPHPAARQNDTVAKLQAAAGELGKLAA